MKIAQCSLAALLLAGAALAGAAQAQVSATTPDQLSGIPEGFLPTAKVPNFAARGTPKGYKVNPDKHDFTASYAATDTSGPGGAPGGPPGGAPPGGPPGGGASSGGPSSGAPSCLPSYDGGPYAVHMISTPGRLTVVNEYNHITHRIYIGGAHMPGGKPTYLGDAIGSWDGDTLMVDTINIKEMPGVDLKEHWTKLANGAIQVVATKYDASGHAGAPTTTTYAWRPDISYVEDVCEDFGEAFGASYGTSGTTVPDSK